ncbi:MAG: universal stress protein [Thermoanaerobaculia bacterium]
MRQNVIRKIVVGTDFNELAAAALRFSGGIAARAGAELVVVYADVFLPPPEFTAAQVKHIAETIERSKSRTREQLEHHIRKHVPDGVVWKATVADGLPAPAIAMIADVERADFIAVGTHGRGGLQRLMIGSVAEAVIREAHVPVLTVRSTANPDSIRRILCPINDTDTAVIALEHAAIIADALGVELTLLHVSTAGDEKRLDIERLVPSRLPKATVLHRTVSHHDAAAEILAIGDSGHYDLIVIGAEHKLVRDVTIFGATTASVTRHARTPVLIVARQRTEGRGAPPQRAGTQAL